MAEAQMAEQRRRQSRTLGPGREFRIVGAGPTGEFRASKQSDGTLVFEGLAIRYGATYQVHDMFGTFNETIQAGACQGVIDKADCRFLFNHDGMPLARTTSGTLTLEDTAQGLAIRASIDPRMSIANDLSIALERGDITQMSVGMIVGADEWDADYENRTIYRLSDLLDVSAVTYPASPTTSIELAQRAMSLMPVESRARFRPVWMAARDLRNGQPLSADRAALLQEALEAMLTADDLVQSREDDEAARLARIAAFEAESAALAARKHHI